MLHVTIYKVTESCNYIVFSIIISDLQFTTSKRAISISYILIMDIILMKDSMVISDMLYILQHFILNFIPFLIVNTVVFYTYCPTSPSRLLWKLWTSVKGNDLKWNVLFLKILSSSLINIGNHLVDVNVPSCRCKILSSSLINIGNHLVDVNVRMRRHGLGKRYLQE